jgi:hypothetical protein
MEPKLVCQGREVSGEELVWLREWIGEHEQWSRKHLSRELCHLWGWRDARGRIKDFAARAFLEKLEQKGLLSLPALRSQMSRPRPKPGGPVPITWPTEAIGQSLRELTPVQWILPLSGTAEAKRFDAYVQSYHYLGLRVVGENLKYLVRDQQGRDLACLLFGAAAWKTAARDEFIGWNASQRACALTYLTNNTRYLILPWVKVSELASHLLGQVVRRLTQDWQHKYGHPIYLLESFVDRGRFRGTCYRAANWQCVGQTRGRGRQGLDRLNPTEPVKDVYLYPLTPHFRRQLLEAA